MDTIIPTYCTFTQRSSTCTYAVNLFYDACIFTKQDSLFTLSEHVVKTINIIILCTQGPECESLEIGEINGKKVLFIGVDRSACILIYSFPPDSITPTFESVYRAGVTSDTFNNLLDARNLGDLDPEDLR